MADRCGVPSPDDWQIHMSKWARNTSNPLRKIVDAMKIEPNPSKELIKLSIGTVFIGLFFSSVFFSCTACSRLDLNRKQHAKYKLH